MCSVWCTVGVRPTYRFLLYYPDIIREIETDKKDLILTVICGAPEPQDAVKRADKAAAEAARLREELAAVQAAVEAGDPAAASAALQQVRHGSPLPAATCAPFTPCGGYPASTASRTIARRLQAPAARVRRCDAPTTTNAAGQSIQGNRTIFFGS